MQDLFNKKTKLHIHEGYELIRYLATAGLGKIDGDTKESLPELDF